MSDQALAAEIRENTGKGVARKLRASGRIPAVLYGKGKQTASLSVDPEALVRLLQASGAGRNTLIELKVGSGSHTVLLKDLQRDPVGGHSLHADFFEIDLRQTVEVEIPLHFIGKAPGVDFGGILDHPVRELQIECLPNAIPESVEVDVSSLQIGDSIHVHELVLPEGVELKTEGELAVAICEAPKAEEEEPVEGEAVEGAEPTEGEDPDAPKPEGADGD